MNNRLLGRTPIKVSEVGLGCEHLQGMDAAAIRAVIDEAILAGINIMDVFMPEPDVRTQIGLALKGRREKVVLQGHIGAAWVDGQYCRTREPDLSRRFFQDFLERFQTDYIDIGMLHFVDTEQDYHDVFETGIIEYARQLKAEGRIRAVGMSCHNPVTALKAVKNGLIDVLMFSLNPAYDLLPAEADIDSLFAAETYQNEELTGTDPVRAELYRTCEMTGVAITVMKSLAAGVLLKAETSPFGVALTPAQCTHYALTRPAVASVLIGCRTPEEVRQAVAYAETPAAGRDYASVLSRHPRYSMKGKCMYCNHCLPCPMHLDIAQINKYLDLALVSRDASGAVPASVREHYLALANTASDCIACGSCEQNCPFDVAVIDRMRQAGEVFGR